MSTESALTDTDDSLRAAAAREVSRFLADAVEMAGGPRSVASDLEKLGYVDLHGPFSEEAVRSWCDGGQSPDSDVIFAMARYYEVSLDDYVFGEPEEVSLRDAIHGFHQKRDQLREVLREALREALRELVEADEAFHSTELAIAP